MITTNTKIISDRDIRKKSSQSNFYIIDIKKGVPFYPQEVNDDPWLEHKTITVPAFAAEYNQYPIEWFSVYKYRETIITYNHEDGGHDISISFDEDGPSLYICVSDMGESASACVSIKDTEVLREALNNAKGDT